MTDGDPKHERYERDLTRLISEGRRGDAVTYFMRDMVNLPAFAVFMMKVIPGIWPKMKAVAHTLPYDAAVMNGYRVPVERFGDVRVPTLVMHGGKTDTRLVSAATEVAGAVPGAEHRVLAGQTHNVAAKVLAPALVSFLS
jgi:pimeloyl-ACP methyl ester carboxylesterase